MFSEVRKMAKLVIRFATSIDSFNDRIGKVSSFLILFMMGFMFIEVMLRYFFHHPTMWVHESTKFMFGCFGMLSGGYVLLNRRHIKIDILWSRLSLKKQVILDLLTCVFFFLFVILIIWSLGKAALDSWLILEHTFTPWGPPIYPYKTILLIGGFLLFLQGLSKFILDLKTLLTSPRRQA